MTPAGAVSWVAHSTRQEGGRRRQAKRSYRTKKEAQAALAAQLAAHQTGSFVVPNRMPLRNFVEPWFAGLTIQGRKRTTLHGYRKTLDAYVLPRLGDVSLQDLIAADLDLLYSTLLKTGGRSGTGLSLTTVHHVHAVINKLLHDAERKGLVLRNVARLANAPSLTTARSKGPEMKVWTPTELSMFLKSIEANRNEALFRLLALTGMRRSEVVGLRWSGCVGRTSTYAPARSRSPSRRPSSTVTKSSTSRRLGGAGARSMSIQRPLRSCSATAANSAL